MIIIVSIISEQTLPNYLFIKEFQGKVDKFLFLTTPQMEQQGKTSLICDTSGIVKEQRIKTSISEDILNQSVEKLNKLNLSPDNQYLVNLTGGTKMMAIAVWRFFSEFPHTRFYYVPIGKRVYYELFEGKPSQPFEFTYQLSVQEYLNIYGIRYEHEPLLFSEEQVNDVFKDVKAGGFDLEKFPKSKLKKFGLPATNKQIHTKWFEEYVYYLIRKELNINEKGIITGVKLFAINEEKKNDQYPNDNEVDVLFIFQNRPYLIECKFSIGKEKVNYQALGNHIYKLATINKRFGISAQASIFTLSDISIIPENARIALERRLAITGIRKIFDRNALLQNFSENIKSLIK